MFLPPMETLHPQEAPASQEVGVAPASAEGDTGLGTRLPVLQAVVMIQPDPLTPVRGGTPGPPAWQRRTPLPQERAFTCVHVRSFSLSFL